MSKEALDAPWMTPGEIEVVTRDAFGLSIPRQRIAGLLTGVPKAVSKKRINGKFYFQIMKAGVEALGTTTQSVVFVDPAQALTHIRQVEDLFRGLKGVVCVCDPYVDGRTLDYLAECGDATGIRLLTANISKPGPMRRDLRAFAQQHGALPIEVRQAAQGTLHDRYIVDDDGLLIIGTSLNSFSRKQSFVVSAGPDVRASVLQAFDAVWRISPAFQ
ncbi:hypothetical protein ISU10_11250 [Nocardioides agariphilus]|uniref:PLD-like domain-containing protein n=1 Tax=Nocardioides agariphilus TaxID=433664 RepID=A0A930YIQ7_9ACTN|nr:hypothetical protein [Nocardioides agariphilus]MBF4768343.1 hypothetical protein [Nocardioides agariphilus]